MNRFLRLCVRVCTPAACAFALAGCYGGVSIGFGDDHFYDTRPAVSLAGPDTVTTAGTVTLSAAATDDWGVRRVEFYQLDAGGNAVLLASDDSAPYTLPLAVTRAENGIWYYYARAIDTAGQSADSAVFTLTVAIP